MVYILDPTNTYLNVLKIIRALSAHKETWMNKAEGFQEEEKIRMGVCTVLKQHRPPYSACGRGSRKWVWFTVCG